MFSTPAMIKYMELTSGDLVFPHLPAGYNPVTRVCINHLALAPIGSKILVKSTLVDMDRKRLTFQVEAYFGEIIIGSGSYEQFVIELEKFMNI
jgi:predicted thioesterase